MSSKLSDKDITTSNALINDDSAPTVSVFVGGTSGVGKFTIEALVRTGASTRIYLVGRKSSKERMETFIKEQHTINPKAEIVWVEGEVSLLADSKRVCDVIKAKESRLDLLFLSAGYASLGGREETSEGLEVTQVLEYYSRMLFVQELMPLLKKAEAGRVVTVLGGGLEKVRSLDVDDLGLKKPGNFSPFKAQGHFLTMMTLHLEKLSKENPDVTFVHSWPGWVNTGNVDRRAGPLGFFMNFLFTFIVKPLIRILSMSNETSGQRHLFESTSAYYGGNGIPWKGNAGVNTMGEHGNGVFLVNFRGNTSTNEKMLPVLREKALEKVWEHTQEVFRPYLEG
ncbi:NAD(P)-binding protein [Periconia macrospinosa]|uniref:NAD(P)-binding protein n=1 Tax=Periconia macrospinosa TaxID=97972 RepID=A0A2V1DF04_9PLEO|nr:NAD(P)-binding protein [Periconia macrospinosa]